MKLIRHLKVTIAISLFIGLTNMEASEQKFGHIGDLRLESGATIEDCFVGYRDFGQMNTDKSNIVILPTWFGGISKSVANIVKPGSIIDSTIYYVIVVDALGNGISSSPSNSKTRPMKCFPFFSMVDMVNSQYKLLTDILDIQHVHAVIGGSMGGMQTFNWVVEYPDFMDKAVSWVGSPRATASDRLSWTLKMRMIDEGEKYGQPDSVIMKNVNLLQNMIVYSPEFRSLETAYEEFPQFLANIPNKFGATYCMGNYRWQLEAMSTNNITAKFNNSYDDVAKHIKAKMLIIVNKQDHIVSPIPSLQLAKTLKAKTLILDNNRGHLGISPEMKKVSKTIHRFLK